MSPANLTGVFGKLPAHGDFIQRNLPAALVNAWDEWLQQFVSVSQEQIGENWLNTYLTSPIWRFVLSEGALGQSAWAGILLPSVDRVGRYFPFTALTQLPMACNPLEVLTSHRDWFVQVETVALQALDGQMTVDDLMHEVGTTQVENNCEYIRSTRINGQHAMQIDLSFEEQQANSVFGYFLDSFLTDSLASYSLWSTEGSELVAPCVMMTRNLPQTGGIAAMLDGRWQDWNWPQPYLLQSVVPA